MESQRDVKKINSETCTATEQHGENLHLEFKGDTNKKSCSMTHCQQMPPAVVFPFSRTTVVSVPIKSAQILVKSPHHKKIIELVLGCENIDKYDIAPGDTIGILTSNCEGEVDFIIERLQLQSIADVCCKLSIKPVTTKKGYKLPHYIPTENITPREILRDCLDIRCVPKKQFLRLLAGYCHNPQQRSFLIALSSKEGAHAYREIILDKGLTFVDLLQLYSSCRPPLGLLIEQLPRLVPRPYSIANSPLSSEDLKIIFSLQNVKPGITTKMLTTLATQLIEESQNSAPKCIPIYLRKPNNFRYTANELSQNIIMISVGCAVAPFLGFLEHKDHLMRKAEEHNKEPIGISWLFTGFTSTSTAIYRDLLMDYKERGILTKLFESFSRGEDGNGDHNDEDSPSKYVHQQLRANAENFVELLQRSDTILYVCADGGAGISKSIFTTICECIMRILLVEEEQAVDMLKQYRENGKYREDIWV